MDKSNEVREKKRGVDSKQVYLSLDMDLYNRILARAKSQGVNVQAWITFVVGDKLRALDIAEETSRKVTEQQIKRLYDESYKYAQKTLDELAHDLETDPISAKNFLQGIAQFAVIAQEQEKQDVQNAE